MYDTRYNIYLLTHFIWIHVNCGENKVSSWNTIPIFFGMFTCHYSLFQGNCWLLNRIRRMLRRRWKYITHKEESESIFLTSNAYIQLKIWVQQYLRFYAIFTTQHLVYLYGVTTVCNEIYSWMYSFKGQNNALDWLISLRSTGSIWLSLFWWCIGTLLWRLLTVSWKSIILKYKKKIHDVCF